MQCLVTTSKIKELAKGLPGETEESVKGLIGVWRENNKIEDLEKYPTILELDLLRSTTRNTNNKNNNVKMLEDALSPVFDSTLMSSIEELSQIDLVFDPKTRRDRITLIARLFSNEIDLAMKDITDSINNMLENSENEEEKIQLTNQLLGLTRLSVIEKETPKGLFDKVLNKFKLYIEDSDEGRIQAELEVINSMKGADKYTDELKRAAATKKALYKNIEYQKIVDYFDLLAKETCSLLKFQEGIRLDPDYVAHKESELSEEDNISVDLSEMNDTEDDIGDNETKAKESWMTSYREVSSHESLSQEVRKAISKIPWLDKRGKYDKDDLGFTRYLDSNYVHATLIDKLKDMVTSDDMIPLLEDLALTKTWVKQVIKILQEDEILFSKFYQDFRKDFLNYWVQKKILNHDGTYSWKTIPVNKSEGTYYLLDSWRDNHENSIILTNYSIYDKLGNINELNVKLGLGWVNNLQNQFSNISTEEMLKKFEDLQIWYTINTLLQMIGIDANQDILKVSLTNIKEAPGITFTRPITSLLSSLNVIFSGILKGKLENTQSAETLKNSNETDNESDNKIDLINTFGSAYNSIADLITEVTDDAIESSVRENEKSYYSHVTPNYLGKLIKQLKNVSNDAKKFDEFIQTEFKQYEWFYKDGKWRNDWLRQLVENPKTRRELQHKVVLNQDKVEYTKWDDLDYTLALLAEYWYSPEDSRSSEKWAYYHVPILSNAPSAEFIRFRKYVSGVESDEDGNKLSYEDIILDKMVDLVQQEYDRIMLVIARDEQKQEDLKENRASTIEYISNYDIIRDSKGKIKKIGGAEFKFLPYLNTLKYENGKNFLDSLHELSTSDKDGNELKNFIKEAVKKAMEVSFAQAYSDWHTMGLFTEVNGKYKYLPKFGSETQHNKKIYNALAKAKNILGLSYWDGNMEGLLKLYEDNSFIDDSDANKIKTIISEILNKKVEQGQASKLEVDQIIKTIFSRSRIKEALREYFWNSKLATSQIIQLTTTDLAFYSSVEDFQKRFKEIHAPSLRLNTKATYKGVRVGRDIERTIYIKDEEIISSCLEDIKVVLDTKVKKGELKPYDRDNIINKFKEVNVADALAYRSMSSYKAIMVMSGLWNDTMEKAYNNFLNNTWDISDFNIIWQTKKPFVYTQVNNDSGIQNHTGIKTPVLHKNSEFLLLAMHALVSGTIGKSSKLVAINEFMEENNIDVVQFESTTKVGKLGVVDLSNINSKEDVKKELYKYAKPNGIENPNVIHKISYEDYGIQVETPEHIIDTIQLVGTQIRKLITADIDPNTLIEIPGFKEKLTKSQWLSLYNSINTENIIESFSLVNSIFKDPKLIEKILLEEMRGNPRYSLDMIEACTLDANGNFNIPLFDPIQSIKIQSLLNSVLKSRITKQKIRGGALIQVSDYGLTEELSIVFKDKLGNIMSWDVYKKTHKNSTREEYNSFVNKVREEGDLSIAYLECYMPAYSKSFYEPLMKKGTHELDISKLPDDLRKLIGYRVPTEDKYSMIPLYIKGFLPLQNGSAIMLPAEITTLTGSDFDVDKLYVMLPEFKIKEQFNIKNAWDDFYKENPDIVNQIDSKINDYYEEYLEDQAKTLGKNSDDFSDDELDYLLEHFNNWVKEHKRYEFSEEALNKFNKWFKNNKSNYFVKKTIEKIKYDFDKEPHENSKEARNNLLIDMMWGILTNSDTAGKMLNPGGFDYQKRASRIIDILENNTEKELLLVLNLDPRNYENIIEELQKKDLDFLNAIQEKTKKRLDPLSPRTQVILHLQNMTSGRLIGMYANHNANHALMQHTELGLSLEYGAFVLNDKKLTSLHSISNDLGEFISRNNAGFLAASVDDVKDPILASLNQNDFTADVTMLLSRLGYNPIEIGIFLNQPIIKDITKAYFRESREGKGKDTIIDNVIKSYKEKAAMREAVSYDNYKNNKFLIENLARNIIIAKEARAITNSSLTSDYGKVEFYKKQVSVGFLFKRILTSAECLGDLVSASRSDTSGGAAGPSIADTIIKIQKIQDFIVDSAKENFPLVGANVLEDDIDINSSEEDLRGRILRTKLPFLQAFYTLGVKAAGLLFELYFPQMSEPFNDIINEIRMYTRREKLNVKTMNSIYNDLFAYIMSDLEFFGDEIIDVNGEHRLFSSFEKRQSFINTFPLKFKKVVSENPDIASLEFIKRLKFKRKNANNPVDTVIFKNVGHLSPILKERYTRDWASLLYMDNIEARKLALNLFKYSYYRNGFAFGPETFIHLAPIVIRHAIPGYIERLRSLLNTTDDFTDFIELYIYNHLDNRQLVPEIPEDSTIQFLDNNGNIKDVVSVQITDNSSSSDKKIVRKQYNTLGEILYDYFKFIAKRHGTRFIYYRLQEDSSTKDVAVYERIDLLGFKNSFIEYEYGKDVSEMKSAIEKNDKKYTNPRDFIDSGSDDSKVPDMPQWLIEQQKAMNSIDNNRLAYEQYFLINYLGDQDGLDNNSNDISKYTPNADYRDANNKNLCGAQLLKKY